MATLTDMLERLRGIDLERMLGLRPDYPRTALELTRGSLVVVRVKNKRRGASELESYRVLPLEEPGVPANLNDADPGGAGRLAERLRELFEGTGGRPGKISLVLPDNLARLSLVQLPERPPSRRQLEEVIRFQVRRSVPFRMSDAVMSYQQLPASDGAVPILVALMRRALVERYEHLLEALGARPGLVDLCTPNLLNLCRGRIEAASEAGDVAFLNHAGHYFSLAIFRGGKLDFLRCKSFPARNGNSAPAPGALARELSYSLSYYEEKLGGSGIRTLLARCSATPFEELSGELTGLQADQIELIDPVAGVAASAGPPIEAATAQQLAPALGAVLGRS